MSNKIILYGSITLIILDIILILVFITQPPKDRVHGGLGTGLMALYGLGFVVLLLIYESIVLIFYFKNMINIARGMVWFLFISHAIIAFFALIGFAMDAIRKAR